MRFVLPLDVQKDEDIAVFMRHTKEQFGQIDFLLHSIAFATLDDLKKGNHCDEPRRLQAGDGDQRLQLACGGQCGPRDLFTSQLAVLTLTYFGGERIVPGYNVMGICKAARRVHEVRRFRTRS